MRLRRLLSAQQKPPQNKQCTGDHHKGCGRHAPYAAKAKSHRLWLGIHAERMEQSRNEERPHQFLRGRTPGALYHPSTRSYSGALPALEYPGHFLVKRVTNAGTIRFKTRLLYLSTALKQHRVGLEEVDDGIWSVFFCDVLLGRIDERHALVRGQLGVTHVPG